MKESLLLLLPKILIIEVKDLNNRGQKFSLTGPKTLIFGIKNFELNLHCVLPIFCTLAEHFKIVCMVVYAWITL